MFFAQISKAYEKTYKEKDKEAARAVALKMLPLYINKKEIPNCYSVIGKLLAHAQKLDLENIPEKLKALKKPTKVEQKNILFSQEVMNALTLDGKEPYKHYHEDYDFPFIKTNVKPGIMSHAGNMFTANTDNS